MIYNIKGTCSCYPSYHVEIPDDTPEPEQLRVAVIAAVQAGASLDGANLDDGSKLVGDRPILILGPLGSRSAYLTVYLTDGGLRFRAGCWFGDEAAFLLRVAATHGDRNHGADYQAAVAFARMVLCEGRAFDGKTPTNG